MIMIAAVFSRLNTLSVESRSIHGGEHLVCVYGDNWLQVGSALNRVVVCYVEASRVARAEGRLNAHPPPHAQRNAPQSTSYSLTALLAELDPKTVEQVKDCDERIRRKRKGACVRLCVYCCLL